MRETKQEFYENGNLRSCIQCRIPYNMGHVVDCTVPVLDEDGEVYRTDIWRDGKCKVFNNAGSLTGEFALFNGVPCDSFQEFLDLNFDSLTEDCETFFNHGENSHSRENFCNFFRECFEKIMEGEGRDSKAAQRRSHRAERRRGTAIPRS